MHLKVDVERVEQRATLPFGITAIDAGPFEVGCVPFATEQRAMLTENMALLSSRADLLILNGENA